MDRQITMHIILSICPLLFHGQNISVVLYNSVTTNNVIGPDNGDISPALVHINLGCNANFTFQNGLITNSNIIGMIKWKTIDDVRGKGYL